MPRLYVEEVYPNDTGCPMIVNFQNGYPTDNFTSSECLVFENENNNKKTIALDLDDLLYAGEENEEQLGKTILLARNKNTGKVRLIEVNSVNVKPVLKINKEKSPDLENSNLELTRKFGSKKQKQVLEHREKLKMNADAVNEQMTHVTKNLTEDQTDLTMYNKNDSDDFYLPVIDRSADKIEDVYDINKILTDQQYDKIYSELQDTDYASNFNPWLKSIVETKTLTKRETVLAVYANALFILYSTLMKDITKKNFTMCESGTLNEIILNNFLSNINGKRGRPPQYKDKTLCHALVFAFLINNYKFDFDSLCQFLKLTPKSLQTKVTGTGASLVNQGSKKIAHLKLPLNRPAFRRKSAKF